MTLTPRELEYVRLRVGEELYNKEITSRMNISLSTAKFYGRAISTKLGFASANAAVSAIKLTKWAIKAGILTVCLAGIAHAQCPATPQTVCVQWDQPCPTCDQTKVYRNGVVLATLTPAVLSYLDANVTAGTTYPYYLTNVAAGVESAPSATASATVPGTPPLPPPPPAFTPIQVNTGGPAYSSATTGTWTADTQCPVNHSAAYTHAITGTTDQKLYQSECWGPSTYTFSVPAGAYTVTLKFAENSFTKSGQRVFNASINGNSVLSKYDIIVSAGGEWKAVDKSFPISTTGPIVIAFTTGGADQPLVNAIQIVASGPPPPPPPPPPPALTWTCSGAICQAGGGTSGQQVPTQLNPPNGPTGVVTLP